MRSFVLLLVLCVDVVLSTYYYQKEYSGYLFTIPGFNDAERRSQDDSRTWCNGNGSKLLAITNQSIQSAAVAFLNNALNQKQITGNTFITDGNRSDGDWTWGNGTTPTTLRVGQDGDLSNSYAYLYVPPASSSFGLYASTPTEKKYFICEGQVFCGNGYQIHGQCFQSFRDANDQVSWFEARNRCLQRGADLATFEFITTYDGLNALNGSWLTLQTQYWIGLRRQWWTWQSINSDVTYSQWFEGRPMYDFNQQCLCLLPNNPVNDWKWSECNCNQVNQFVCISSPASAVTSTSLSMPFPSTGSSFTTAITIRDNNNTFKSSGSQNAAATQNDKSLAIGLGVGLGGGLLLIVVIVVVVFILCLRKGHTCFKRGRAMAKESPTHSDVVALEPPGAIYVDVVKKKDDLESEEKEADDEQIQYAEFQIIGDHNKTPQNQWDLNKESVSSSHRNTIVPPNFAKLSDDDDAVEYGQVDKRN